MKKILLIILMFVCMMGVKADMGEPMMPAVDLVVSNKSGTYIYEMYNNKYIKTDVVIPYDTKISILSEFYYKNELYGYFTSTDEAEDEKKEGNYSSGYVKLKDCIVLNDAYPEPKIFDSEIYKLYIFKSGGVDMYAGPSTKFKKLNVKIPEGAIATHLSSGFEAPTIWAYVEYNGTRGWIYYIVDIFDGMYGEDCNVAEENDTKLLLVGASSVNIYKNPAEDKDAIVGTVSKNEELACEYSYGYNTYWCYITKGDVSGWVYVDNKFAVDISNDKILLLKETTAFDAPKDNPTISTTIPIYTSLKVDYEYDYSKETSGLWYRVTYNNKQYWLLNYDGEDEIDWKVDKKYGISSLPILDEEEYHMFQKEIGNVNIYDDYTNKNNEIATYNNETILELYENQYYYEEKLQYINYYIVTNNYRGWFTLDSKKVTDIYNKYGEESEPSENGEPEVSDLLEDISKLQNDQIESKNYNLTHKQIIYLSIGGAIVLALTATVTIILINKKKKEKNSQLINSTIVNPSGTNETNVNENNEKE